MFLLLSEAEAGRRGVREDAEEGLLCGGGRGGMAARGVVFVRFCLLFFSLSFSCDKDLVEWERNNRGGGRGLMMRVGMRFGNA